jgi:hypothetical protein
MNIENEISRLFGLWIVELEDANEHMQATLVRAVLSAFLKWYDN